MKEPPHPVLAQGKVRHVGDPVAVVIAETPRPQAQDAAELVDVDYDVLPAVADLARCGRSRGAAGVARRCAGQHLLRLAPRRQGGDRRGVRRRRTRVELDLVNNRLDRRTRWSRAPRSATTTARTTTTRSTRRSQNPHVIRLLMGAFVLHIPEHKLRVIAPDVGGGFGSKIYHYAEEAIVTWAAGKVQPAGQVDRRAQRELPVRRARPRPCHARRAGARRGRQVPRRCASRTLANMGAYLSTFAPCIPTYLYATLLAGAYTTPGDLLPR